MIILIVEKLKKVLKKCKKIFIIFIFYIDLVYFERLNLFYAN